MLRGNLAVMLFFQVNIASTKEKTSQFFFVSFLFIFEPVFGQIRCCVSKLCIFLVWLICLIALLFLCDVQNWLSQFEPVFQLTKALWIVHNTAVRFYVPNFIQFMLCNIQSCVSTRCDLNDVLLCVNVLNYKNFTLEINNFLFSSLNLTCR